jgi:phage gp45-like
VYNSEHKPDFKTDNGAEEVLVSKSPKGSEIRMLDKENSKKIHIHCPGGSVEVVAANIHLHAGNQIEIQAKKIDISAEEKITMTAKDIEMNVQNNLVQSAGNEAELKATTSVKINSTQVESSAAGNNVIKGAIVQIN